MNLSSSCPRSSQTPGEGITREVTHNVRNLAKGLVFSVFRRLVGAFHDVDGDELERDVLSVQDGRNVARAG